MDKSKFILLLSIQMFILVAYANQTQAIIHRLQKFEINDVENIKNIFNTIKRFFKPKNKKMYRIIQNGKNSEMAKKYFFNIITENIRY